MNKVILEGVMAREPQVREVGNGKVCNFTVKCTDTVDVNGTPKELTSYVNCVAWNEYADQYISAMVDEPVNVEGRLTTRSYEKDGRKHYVTEVNVNK
jgi:single-strand DNA-binding protein|nr:MAG TPA: Single strand binding protein [Caudoviricetes sp.]DAV58765.1 MAG TPA: Single strand binding protein [Caudoviricetes sp.]